MMNKFQRAGVLFLLLAVPFSQTLQALPATQLWTATAAGADLNNTTNWTPNGNPTGNIVQFDSAHLPLTSTTPTATALFNVDSFSFLNSASYFSFTFNGAAGALQFTGPGITGAHTDTTIGASNAFGNPLTTPQINFFTSGASGATTAIGKAAITATNEGIMQSGPNNMGQIVLANIDVNSAALPITVDDNASITVNNGSVAHPGGLAGNNEAAQIFLKGQAFGVNHAATGVTITAKNINGSLITAASDAAQLLVDAAGVPKRLDFTLGDNAKFIFTNDNTGNIESSNNNVGQIVLDGNKGSVAFSVGKGSVFTLTNSNYSSINQPLTFNGNDGGQIVLDGNKGIVFFVVDDNATIALNNVTHSKIQGIAFDSAQFVIDADGGVAGFSGGKNTQMTLTNDATSLIESGTDGNDAAQLLVDGNDGSAFVVLGDNSAMNATNAGTIQTGVASAIAGQIVFDGRAATAPGVYLNAGNNVAITATNSGQINNAGIWPPAAQIYFSDARVSGNPTITAINNAGPNDPTTIPGIVFDGTSTADAANIVLKNASLRVATNNPLTIGSLTGDAPSTTDLLQTLKINTAPGVTTTFGGVIQDVVGFNSLIISGAGTQVLTGANTYAGGTTVNSGRLVVDGSVIGNMYVTGGVLAGTGSIGSVGSTTYVTGGVVKPGDNGPGVLTNVGDYIQTGGTLQIDLNGLGNVPGINNGELVVGGTTILSSPAFVTVNSEDGSFFLGGKYTIVDSTGIVNGTFSPFVLTNTSVIPEVTYDDDHHVYLNFQDGFLACACDNNGRNVAYQLFDIVAPTQDELALLTAITQLSCAEIGAALDDLSGANYAELLTGVELSTHQFVRRLYDPLRTFLTRDLSCCSNDCCCNEGIEFWLEGGGVYSQFKHKQHANNCCGYNSCGRNRGLKTEGYQVSGGAQMEGCDKTWVGGVAVTYEHSTNKLHHGRDANSNTILGALYGAYRSCDYYLMGDLVIGGSEAKVKRHFFIGDNEYHLHGKPEALQGILYVEAGLNFRNDTFVVQPFLGLEGGYFNYKSVKEHGDNVLGLELKKRNYGTFDTRLGVHLAKDDPCTGTFVGVDLAWQCRCTDFNNYRNAEFEFGHEFRVDGSNLCRNSFEAALNVEQKICDGWSVYATGFWQQWSQNSYAFDILGGISYNW